MFNTLKVILLVLFFYPLSGQLTLNDISVPSNIKEGDYHSFSIIKSEDNSGNTYTCRWDFGDGNSKELLNGFNAGHTYMDNDNYILIFEAEDEEGNKQEISKQVNVENVAPEIRFLDGQNADYANNKAEFQSVVYEPGDDEISYKWDFGDGQTKEGKSYNNISHIYQEPGVYNVRLTVDDGDGGTDYKTMTISVENDWYGTISGDINGTFSGGTSILYQSFTDTTTGELVTCFKAITLFDDNNNSFFWIFSNNLNRLSNNTHSIGNGDDEVDIVFRYDMITSLYENQKTGFRSQEVLDDWTRLAGSSFRSLSLFSDMRRAANTGEDIFGEMFEDESGTIKFEHVKGDRLKGTVSATICDQCDSDDPENPPRYANINLNFNIWINDVAAFSMNHGCEEEPNPFSILDYSPRHDKVNVNPEDPCIELTFSENVDPESVNPSNVKLGYNASNGQFKIEDIAIDYSEEKKIRIIPINELRKGVKYEVKIQNGNGGIKSIEGGELAEAENWRFSTLVEPSTMKVRVYQSVADAPLIEDKNTMVRIQVEWDKPSDLSEESFVSEFPAIVNIRDSNGNNLGQTESFTIEHQSRFSDEDIRMAENSLNFYSWKPKPSNGSDIKIEVIPEFQKCQTGDEDTKYEINHPISHSEMKPQLKMEYYYLKSNLTDIITELELSNIYSYIQKNNRLSEQIFPIYDIQSSYKGSILAESIFAVESDYMENITDPNLLQEVGLFGYMLLQLIENGDFKDILDEVYREIVLNSNADIVVFLYGFSHGSAGAAYGVSENDEGFNTILGKEFITIRFEDAAGHLIRPTLTHELGHSFQLDHIPYVESDDERTFVSNLPFDHWENENWHDHIEGFRIVRNGSFGYNKSCSEGNAESGSLTSIMFPHAKNVFYNEPWIDKRQYKKALDHIKQTGKGLSFVLPSDEPDNYWVSNNTFRNPDNSFKTIYISGKYNKGKNAAAITSLNLKQGYQNINLEPGYLTIRCLDQNGNIINQQSFNPETDLKSCSMEQKMDVVNFFTAIEVPEQSNPGSIQILDKDKVIAEYIISKFSPEIEILSPSNGDTINDYINLNWKGFDQDNEEINYTIYYSPGNLDQWNLVGMTKDTSLSLNVSTLKAGETPTIKVVASDGFLESEDYVNFNLDFPFKVVWYSPSEQIEQADQIDLLFSNPIRSFENAEKWFELIYKDKRGNMKRVDYSVGYSEDRTALSILPFRPLEKDVKYYVSYGEMPSKEELAAEEEKVNDAEQKKSRGPKGSLKKWLAKQVDKLTADDENSNNREVLKDILGLPNESKKEPEPEVVENRKGQILERVLGPYDEDQPVYLIEDIFGNKLEGFFSWSFEIK